MLWPAAALDSAFNDGQGIKRLTLLELAQLGWIEVVDPQSVEVTEQAPGVHGVAYVGPMH
jgi:hypothetical protein